MPFQNKYLKYALMDDDEPPEAAKRPRKRIITFGKSGDINIEFEEMPEPYSELVEGIYEGGKHMSTNMDRWYERVHDIVVNPHKYKDDPRTFLEGIGDALQDDSPIITLGSKEQLGYYAKLVDLARKYAKYRQEDPSQRMSDGDRRDKAADLFNLAGILEHLLSFVDRIKDAKDAKEMIHFMNWLSLVFGAVLTKSILTKRQVLDLYNKLAKHVQGQPAITMQRLGKFSFSNLEEALDKQIRMNGGSFATKLYQIAANTYRGVACPKARKLKDGEIHPLCANWMGPGTDIEEARKYPSANAADDCARVHDIMYYYAAKVQDPIKRANAIRYADDKIISCLSKTNDPPYTQLGLAGIATKMKAEDLIPGLTKALMGKETANSYFGQKAKKVGGCLSCNNTCSNWKPYKDGRIQM